MTHLSDFLHQIHASAGDWIMLAIRGDAMLIPARSNDVLFYILLEGEVTISATGNRPLHLAPSDVAMVFGGVAHELATGPDRSRTAFNYFDYPHDHDIPPSMEIGTGPVRGRLMVGKVRISWPVIVQPAAMPNCLLLHMGPTEASAAEIVGLFTRAQKGVGASAYLTKLAELALLRTLRENVELLRSLPPDAASLQIARALRLIRNSPSEHWTVARLAREVGMSRSSFADKFVLHAGRPPMEAVTEVRMRRAAEMLGLDRSAVGEIALCTGYRSEAAFARRFEQFFGTTPGRYRKRLRDEQKGEEVRDALQAYERDPAAIG